MDAARSLVQGLLEPMLGMSNKRRHPRIPVHQKATAEVRTVASLSLGATSQTRITLAVTIREISREGLQLQTEKLPQARGTAALALERGSTVTVKLAIGGRTLSVPGSVMWTRRATDAAGEVLAGVRMHVQVLDSATRRLLEAWILEAERSFASRTTASAV